MASHPDIERLIKSIDLEEKEQANRYRLDQQHTLRQMKAEGIALHPLKVTRRSFGYADYPEIDFRIEFPPGNNMFRDGAAIECFYSGEEPVKGILLRFEGKTGSFRLFAPDYPDWIELDGMGIKLAPDTRTTTVMKQSLRSLEKNKKAFRLFESFHGTESIAEETAVLDASADKGALNESQQRAVKAVLTARQLTILHGPPGTGKTTTLVEAIRALCARGEKVLLSAPSNTAVDHISKELLKAGVKLLRVGNMSKVDELIFPHTPEGHLKNSKAQKDIKTLHKRADEFRRMALKYKRSFGKSEREQRNLLFKEVKKIREEIRQLQAYNEEKLFADAQVISGTPIGLHDAGLEKLAFQTLVIDEAGQCLEPLAWCIIPLAEKLVLAGDHLQLPPTVLSHEAARDGLSRSILELAITRIEFVQLLNTQYRMRASIAGFSSQYFYKGELLTAKHLDDISTHISFVDTAGSGYQEERGSDGNSLQNPGELNIIQQLIEHEISDLRQTAIISPYAGQVALAKDLLPSQLRISTIDSFQGQEMESIIISLVRSNEDGDIGFLKDYRRMNVAITRAKERLFVIGDSATLGADPFYRAFLEYVELKGSYRTVWEFEM